MRLKTKMFLGSAFLAVIPVVVTAYFTAQIATRLGQEALTEAAQSHISSIRDTKKAQVESYFQRVIDQLQIYAASKTVIDVMNGFKEAYPKFSREAALNTDEGPPIPKELPIDEYRIELTDYYTGEFAEEYGTLNVEPLGDDIIEQYIDKLDENSIALQYFYIADNPNPLGTKEEFSAASDSSSYTQLHRNFHAQINDFAQRFGFQDIYLIDAETGYIVYSVLKQIDFATSLKDGAFAGSGLGRLFEESENFVSPNEFFIVDFSPYIPSYNSAAAFISAGIFDGEKKIGIIAFQLPIDKINDIMTYDRAWRYNESGRTGETYIVAADGAMRSDSRQLVENKDDYLIKVEQTGLPQEIISSIELKDTSVLLQRVDTGGTSLALNGLSGFEIFEDYRGDNVLSAYAPLNIPHLQWAVFSDFQEQESFERLQQLNTEITIGILPVAAGILLFGGIAGFFIFGRIAAPIGHLEATVTKVAEGDFSARADIKTGDELETLSSAFNGLLEDRLSALAKAEKENEMLNNSIIELLKASFQLSQRDLTVQVPVTEDVTGPLADAINQMATETSKVLLNVRRISDDVEAASQQVKVQGDNVVKVAEAERAVVDTTMAELSAAAEAMNKIAEVAQSCNEIATQATRSTQTALATVTSTVDGMGEIRETIRETEKRIKRLGERSQEISSIVDIINNIAERTHVLALNASMQAAAAGEAGRGFSVVADEVQRLAESSRNATSQISALVKNIQVETNDTIATMDKTIQQVVEGSRLAERAGEQMKETQNTTANLVQVVEQIAMASRQQAQISNELRERAQTIQMSTQETGKQLEEQTIQTERLVEYSKQLIESVRVFKLPTV